MTDTPTPEPSVAAPPPRLALRGISRRYGAVTALDAATLLVRPGTVHALLGENGAGKSTLMKIAFGLERPDTGTLAVDGRIVAWRTPRDAMGAGIGMVQQHFSLVAAMTVAENVALGGTGRFDREAARALVRDIGRRSGLVLDPDARVADLPVGAQQRLEIVKALARDARTLILDEPTAVLAPAEVDELLAWLRRFATEGGTVILIAHKLAEVLRVADEVTVLRRGRTVHTAAAHDVTAESLAAAMLGAPLAAVVGGDVATAAGETDAASPAPRARPPRGAPVLVLEGAGVTDARGVVVLRDATMAVHAGEIVGVAAVEGAGQHELLRLLAGRLAPTRGRATIPDAVGFVPEDRHRDAVVLDATLVENLALRDAGMRTGLVPWRALATDAEAMMAARDVRAASATAPMRALSGGNQQKFVLGRELAGAPAALVVENPTRGLDIRATADVLAALRDARDAGVAVVIHSSDLDEVLAVADRIVVCAGGAVRDVAHDRDAVGRAMLAAGDAP
ncbi:MAG: ABC transporter ATP-binding protein [Gemmatimonadaceae bacterium]|nr:ABC transporter ATP-binding protein [Gemmatimonadaceae bacterium]